MLGGEAGRHVAGRGKPRVAGAAAARGAGRGGGAARPGRRHHGRQREARGPSRHAAPQARRQGNLLPLLTRYSIRSFFCTCIYLHVRLAFTQTVCSGHSKQILKFKETDLLTKIP